MWYRLGQVEDPKSQLKFKEDVANKQSFTDTKIEGK